MKPDLTKLEELLMKLFVIDEAEGFTLTSCCDYHYYYENLDPPWDDSEGG